MKRFAFAALFILASGAHGQTEPLEVGVWKMNREKSRFTQFSTPYSLTMTVEVAGNGLRHTAAGLTAGGREFKIVYTAYYDGQDWPVTGSPSVNTRAFRRVDARRTEEVDKWNGRVVQSSVRTISEDGRTLEIRSSPSEQLVVYERQ